MDGIDEMNAKLSFSYTSVLNLKKISSDKIKSKYIVIAVEGFLTEDSDKREVWRHIINHYTNSECFALAWNSLSLNGIFNEGYFRGRKKKNFL